MGKKNKSKAPNGRAGAKQKAKKGGPNADWTSSLAGSSKISRQILDDTGDDDTGQLFKGFSQNNSRNFSPRNSAFKLRHQAISFVSAGTNTPIEFQPKPSEDALFQPAEDSGDEDEEGVEEEEFHDTTLQTNILLEAAIDLSEGAIAHMNLQSSGEIEMADSSSSNSDVDIIGVDKDVQHDANTVSKAPLFFVDTTGDPSLAATSKANGKHAVRREPSPAPSDSSEELVVFHGRNKPVNTPETSNGRITSGKPSELPKVVGSNNITNPFRVNNAPDAPSYKPATPQSLLQQGRSTNGGHKDLQPQAAPPTGIGWAARAPRFDAEVNHDATWAPAPAGSWWKRKNNRGQARPDLDPPQSEKMALDNAPPKASKVAFAEPTVEGLRDKRTAKQSSVESSKPVIKSPTSKRRGKRGRKKDNRQMRDPINSDDENDADEAAYDDYMSNLAAQMDGADSAGEGSARFNAMTQFTAFGGPSLVVDGQDIAEDQVLSGHAEMMGADDTSSASSDAIGQDLSDMESNDDLDWSDLDSSELEDQLEYTEKEQWEDEVDLRRRRQEAMQDEQIARMFQKQEELGYHGDDLVLENGEYVSFSDEIDGVGDIARARAGFASMSHDTSGRSKTKHGTRRHSRRGNGVDMFPDASALADTVEQYGENGFDIMDLDRPSLRQTKRGRKGKLPPELDALSDVELKDSLLDSWNNDRRKKSLKKQEREAARMEGLLGAAGRSGKADLRQKYPYGMNMVQVHEELRTFMENENQQSRSFPPMDKHDRKALHEIVSVLKLKSKSVGSGKDRYPVVYKTPRSAYSPEMFEKAIAKSAKGLLGRGSKAAKNLTRKNAKAAMARGNTAAATLRNGEIVGAGAAALGKENMGHRLMERMGWNKGQALGKDGEGRLNPVEQVVRLGTAGLG